MKAAPRITYNTHTPPTNPGATCRADKWQEYERLKNALPLTLSPAEYDEAIRRIAEKLRV